MVKNNNEKIVYFTLVLWAFAIHLEEEFVHQHNLLTMKATIFGLKNGFYHLR